MTERERLIQGVERAEFEDILCIIAAALRLERAMYAEENTVDYLFRLRKSLEGVWGELPEVDEWGDDEET